MIFFGKFDVRSKVQMPLTGGGIQVRIWAWTRRKVWAKVFGGLKSGSNLWTDNPGPCCILLTNPLSHAIMNKEINRDYSTK
jgi:hypothetical protein